MIRISNDRYSLFLRQADALRRSGSFCDAVVSVRGRVFRAHRLVLACASGVLARRLDRPKTSVSFHCVLEEISPHVFQQVLDFAYTESLEVSADDLLGLLRAAQLLEMPPLEEQCLKRLDALGAGKPNRRADVKEKADSTQRDSPPPTKEDDRFPAPSDAHAGRDSVIKRSLSSPCPPWVLPHKMWSSVGNLREIRETYSQLFASQPRQTVKQLSLSYLMPLPDPHLLRPPGVDYAGFYPFYTQSRCDGAAGSGDAGEILLKKRNTGGRTMTDAGEAIYPEVLEGSAQKSQDCQQCCVGLLTDPARLSAEAGSVVLSRAEEGVDLVAPASSGRQEKPYQCKHCNKHFSLKHQLLTHHRIHTGEKPFECRLCGQRSRDYSAMIKHLRTHGGASPYQCTACLEFCSSLVDMQRHVKSHAVQDFPPDWSIKRTYLYTSHI